MIEIVYLIGCFISFVISLIILLKHGTITAYDLFVLLFCTLLSWAFIISTLLIWVGDLIENLENVVIWKRKSKKK